jgi:hypothetical protein
MKYLLNSVDTYRVETVEEVERLHEALKNDPNFTLVNFSYKTKEIKVKGEVIETYQVVSAKKFFTSEKEPDVLVDITYEVD